jgi:hypothetical protein
VGDALLGSPFLSGLGLSRFQFQAMTQGPQRVERVIDNLAFLTVVTAHRKQFSRSPDEGSLSLGDARREFLPVSLEQRSYVQFTPTLEASGCRAEIPWSHEFTSLSTDAARGSAVRQESQFAFGNAKLRRTTTQADHKFRKYQDSRLVQTFESGEMDVNFRTKFVLVIGKASPTGHDEAPLGFQLIFLQGGQEKQRRSSPGGVTISTGRWTDI